MRIKKLNNLISLDGEELICLAGGLPLRGCVCAGGLMLRKRITNRDIIGCFSTFFKESSKLIKCMPTKKVINLLLKLTHKKTKAVIMCTF